MHPQTTKDVGIWIRVSTEFQVAGESPEHHEERAKSYAKFNNWNVVRIYRLDALSGKSVMGLAQTKQMLQDVRSGVISGLIFSKLARLARNTKELLDFADIFQKHNADLISLGEKIDTSTPAGRLFYTIIAAMAEWERSEISERVKASVVTRANMGKRLGGAAPFGFQWQNQKLILDQKEAPIRKLMFELFLKHQRRNTVARELNNMGYRTRRGAKFSDTTVTRLLQDPIAMGKHRQNYTRSLGSNKAWEIKDKSEWVINDVPPIVSEALYMKVNRILSEQQARNKRVSTKPKHLFIGYIYCHCGSRMNVPGNMKKYTCTSCRNKIPIDDMEEIFMEQLHNFVMDETEMKGIKSRASEQITSRQQQLKSIEQRMQSLYDDMTNLINLHRENTLSTSDFKSRYSPLYEQREQLKMSTETLQAELVTLQIKESSTDEIVVQTKSMYDQWSTLAHASKRAFIEMAVDRITISQDEIDITMSYLPKKLQKTLPLKNDSSRSTQPQGFILATNIKDAG